MTQLEQARAKVNSLIFGSVDWEAAMEVVRQLVAEQSAATNFGRHTSIDGDVWSA